MEATKAQGKCFWYSSHMLSHGNDHTFQEVIECVQEKNFPWKKIPPWKNGKDPYGTWLWVTWPH